MVRATKAATKATRRAPASGMRSSTSSATGATPKTSPARGLRQNNPVPDTSPVPPNTLGADFLIVTALPEEREAVLDRFTGWTKVPKESTDVHTYYEAEVGSAAAGGGSYRVIVAMLLRMGPIQAAAQTVAAVAKWNPQVVIMVGIAGGLAGEAALGDVLIADQVVDYTIGKLRRVKGKLRRSIRWVGHPADASLLDSAFNLKQGWHSLITAVRPGRRSKAEEPVVRFGVVISGGDVIADAQALSRYKDAWPKLIGAEMEGGGVATALEATYKPRFFMVRGVSDLADDVKDAEHTKLWRPYACDVAATFTLALIRSVPLRARAVRFEASGPAADLPAAATSTRRRARDVELLTMFLSALDLDRIDYFLDRADSYVVTHDSFYFMEGVRGLVSASRFHFTDANLREHVRTFADAFISCFAFANWFEPRRSGGDDYYWTNGSSPYASEASAEFCKRIALTRAALASLLDLVHEQWSEVHVDETTKAARSEKMAFEARMDEVLHRDVERGAGAAPGLPQ
jgi:nucleoside phosphorylase